MLVPVLPCFLPTPTPLRELPGAGWGSECTVVEGIRQGRSHCCPNPPCSSLQDAVGQVGRRTDSRICLLQVKSPNLGYRGGSCSYCALRGLEESVSGEGAGQAPLVTCCQSCVPGKLYVSSYLTIFQVRKLRFRGA